MVAIFGQFPANFGFSGALIRTRLGIYIQIYPLTVYPSSRPNTDTGNNLVEKQKPFNVRKY